MPTMKLVLANNTSAGVHVSLGEGTCSSVPCQLRANAPPENAGPVNMEGMGSQLSLAPAVVKLSSALCRV